MSVESWWFLGDLSVEWRGEISEFLRGERKEFSKATMMRAEGQEGTEFQKAVWREMMKIPYGEVRSYKQVAEAVGRPQAMRAVGVACGKNKWPIVVPCHRVVASNGLGGFSLGLEIKEELLKLEKQWSMREGCNTKKPRA